MIANDGNWRARLFADGHEDKLTEASVYSPSQLSS